MTGETTDQKPTIEDVAEPSETVEAPTSTSQEDDAGSSGGQKRRRKHRRRTILIVIGVIIVVLAIASVATAEAFSTNAACNSCHEMNPYSDSWSVSTHKGADCVQCHIPPGSGNWLKTKILSLEELWVHVVGAHEPPVAVTRDIPRSSCLDCHPDGGGQTEGTTTFPHSAHTSVACVDCHVRMVHSTVNPPYYHDPMLMARCLKCHNGQPGSPPSNCSTCHTQPHEWRGECGSCHETNSFAATAPPDHPLLLTGGHVGVPCADCHVARPDGEVIPGTSLPVPAGTTCVSCHAVQHQGLTDCAQCHTVESFAAPTFQHSQIGPHIPTGERRLPCQSCHPSTDYTQTSCTPCHDNPPTGD